MGGVRFETVAAQLHRSTGDPQKKKAIRLQGGDVEAQHGRVFHSAVRQVHVDVPRWIRHNHTEVAEKRKVDVSQITLNPLRWVCTEVSVVDWCRNEIVHVAAICGCGAGVVLVVAVNAVVDKATRAH